MIKLKPFFLLIFLNLSFFSINCELKIVCTAALIDSGFESRKQEYITCMEILKQFGYSDPYIIEAIKGSGPTFLDDYSKNVFYSKEHDFNIKEPIKNKGINEIRTMLDGFKHFNFDPDDMIIKLTGRYRLLSPNFINIVKSNPDADIIVKLVFNGSFALTSCFAMRYKYLKEMLENLNLKEMEDNLIYIENKFTEYINNNKHRLKVVYVDHIDIFQNVYGAGTYYTYIF